MATQLQLVNQILRRVRETPVASVVTTSYATMVAEFLNQAKMEVEDAWDWLQLRQTIALTTANGTFKYTLTGAGKRGRILRDYATNPPGWDVVNNTKDYNLTKAPSSAWMTQMLTMNSVQTGDPYWFDVNGQSGGDPQIDLYPIPGSTMTVNVNMCIPQADFSLTGSDNSTVLTVPEWPVVLRAYALVLGERGEDGGTSQTRAQFDADEALWAAITREMMQNEEETEARIA